MTSSEPSLFSSYKNFKATLEFDTIIIGSGISALTTAAILSKEKNKVLVLERHYTPGGLTHTFKRNDYEWDVGVHYIGEVGTPTLIKKTFDYITDTPIEWANMGEVYDKIYFGKDCYELRKGQNKFIAYFSKLFPGERKGIVNYIKLLNDMEKFGMGYYAEKAMPSFISSIFGKWMRKKYLAYSSRSTKEVMDELFTDDKIKAILTSQFGNCGLPPSLSSFAIHASVARHYLEGGYYPVGGSSVFFNKIAPVIKKAGGEILVRAEVSEILVEDGKAIGVKMSDGAVLRSKKVVSTIGTENTYSKLLSSAVWKTHSFKEKMDGLEHSTSYCSLYLGFEHTSEELNLPKSNFWIFPPEYDHDKNVSNFIDGTTQEFPVVYISFPGSKDPDFEKRYPGRTTIEVVTLINYEKFAPWENTRWRHRGNDYDSLKEQISNQLLACLFRYLPQTKGKVAYYELSTPLSVRHFMGHRHGELYGLAHNVRRFNNKMLKPKTFIKGLYLAGQDIVTAGVAGALISGVLCASVMKNRNYVGKIMRN